MGPPHEGSDLDDSNSTAVASRVGSAIGAGIIASIETGIIAAGLTGYVTQFFNGLVIILSLIGYRFAGRRYR